MFTSVPCKLVLHPVARIPVMMIMIMVMMMMMMVVRTMIVMIRKI